MAERTCAWCGENFTVRRSDQRCCDKVCGKKYANIVQRRKHECTCRVCGSSFTATKPSQVCSPKCLGAEHSQRYTGRAQADILSRRARAEVALRRAAKGTRGTGIFKAGPCAWCGTNMATRTHAIYCTSRCAWAADAKRDQGKIHRNTKLRVMVRDGWACWICKAAIDPSLMGTCTSLSPSIDHVIEQDAGGTHDDENLRAAHLGCNSRRGALYRNHKASLATR